jgi:hypothetical protein
MITTPISIESQRSTRLDPKTMERNLRQIHRRLDEYERDLTDYYAVACGKLPEALEREGRSAAQHRRAG